jgi:hypothetical protein
VSARQSGRFGRTTAPTLGFAFDRTSGVNGEKLHLTITTMAKSAQGYDTFVIRSTRANQTSSWYGLVSEQ